VEGRGGGEVVSGEGGQEGDVVLKGKSGSMGCYSSSLLSLLSW
jgi:hypothetical protein